MKWILQAVLELFFKVLCMITNPLVCLFADEWGELHGIWHYWQTYDNTLDVRWMIYEHGCTPKLFHYDYDRHYVYQYEKKSDGRMRPGYVSLIDPEFTLKERIQRYFCRLAWMYRNCNYGFSYYINGRNYNGNDNVVIKNIKDGRKRLWISYVSGGSWWTTTWGVYVFWPWCSRFYLRAYMGWKLMGSTGPYNMRAMLAMCIWPFRK
jgi:hypothetical protein